MIVKSAHQDVALGHYLDELCVLIVFGGTNNQKKSNGKTMKLKEARITGWITYNDAVSKYKNNSGTPVWSGKVFRVVCPDKESPWRGLNQVLEEFGQDADVEIIIRKIT